MNFRNLNAVNINSINILILLFPFSLIAGNLFVNLNIALICLLGVWIYKEDIFKIKKFISTNIILVFFIIVIVMSALKSNSIGNTDGFLKSILYLRYLLFLYILKFALEKKHLNVKYFLMTCLFITLFVSLDVTLQGLTGKNIFGLESLGKHNSSIFGKELVAGSYIQRFFIFGLICLPFVWNKLNNKRYFLISVLILIFFLGALFSGNRISLVMFVLAIFLMIFLFKNLRKSLLAGSLFCLLIFSFLYSKNDNIKKHYSAFYKYSIDTLITLKRFSTKEYPELEDEKYKFFIKEYNKGKDREKLKEAYEMVPFASGHQVVFLTAIDVWADNIFLGNGIKSFGKTCKTKLHLPNRVCETHPHNYYLELLNDTGLIGALTFVISIIYLCFIKFKNLRKGDDLQKLLFYCLLIILFIEFFPLKSSGSFFSTGNSSFIFFIIGLIAGLKSFLKKN